MNEPQERDAARGRGRTQWCAEMQTLTAEVKAGKAQTEAAIVRIAQGNIAAGLPVPPLAEELLREAASAASKEV